VKIAVPKERSEGERRVALVPDAVEKLVSDEHEVVVEAGAGGDFYPDEGYANAGAQIVEKDATADADIVVKVAAPSEGEAGDLPEGSLLVCFFDPSEQGGVLDLLARRDISVFSLSAIPRTGAAQSMDAISSMSSVAGYQAVLMAAEAAGRYLPMMTTAAGTTKAAKVMVLGVGVAGLQAIATARRLGAEVEAFDIRSEVADQVRSLGATFIEAAPEAEDEKGDGGNGAHPDEPDVPQPGSTELFVKALLGLPEDFGRRRAIEAAKSRRDAAGDDGGDGESDEKKEQGGYASEQDEEKQKRDQELMAERLGAMDIVLTTALVPGKRAPTLVTADMVERMKPGAVLFDLAVEAGGNCALSEPGQVVVHDHVRIHGPLNLPSTMPIHASYLLSRNMMSVLSHLIGEDGELELDFEDEITGAAVLAHGGERRDS
jgi:H+-translocating NAD(P) transhydrogenase subunit alpha